MPKTKAKPARSTKKRIEPSSRPAPARIDFRKQHKDLYAASREVEEVTAERATFLAVDGVGEPGGDAYEAAMQRLLALAYTTMFSFKKAGLLDFSLASAECVWFTAPGQPRSQWRWRLLLRIPDEITSRDLAEIRHAIKESKNIDTSAVIRTSWREGRSLQMLHVGPYETLADTYAKLAAEVQARKLTPQGPCHEVYLTDPQQVEPAKLKTIVRMPVKRG